MKRIRAVLKGSAAAVVGVGLLATTPVVSLACESQGHHQTDSKPSGDFHGKDHGKGHENFDTNQQVNVYVNNQSDNTCGCQVQSLSEQQQEHGHGHAHSKQETQEHSKLNMDVNVHGEKHVHSNLEQTMNVHANEHTNLHANAHLNAHANEHTNGHLNEHSNEHLNVHVNEHSNLHTNVHVNSHVNRHVNVHENKHVNVHENEHVNVHVNVHTNEQENVHIKTQGHTHLNVHTNQHTNIHVNIHNKVEAAAYNLETALQNLGCSQSDYLFAYLQSVHIDEKETIQIHDNLRLVDNLVTHFHSTGVWSTTQKQEVLRLFISCASAMHLTASFVDASGHPCDVLQRGGEERIVIQLKDQQGHMISSISTRVSSLTSPSQVTTTIHRIDTAAKNAKQLSDTGKFVAEPVIALPKTATQDPLWMVIGFALMLVGGLALIPVVTLANRRK